MPQRRSMTGELKRFFASVKVPVFLIDAQCRFAYGNTALATALNVDPSTLVGRKCQYHSLPVDDPLDELVAGLCPPPDAFGGATLCSTVQPAPFPEPVESTWIPLPTSVKGQFTVIGILASLRFPEKDPTFEQLQKLHGQLAAFRDEMRRQHPLDLVIGMHPSTQKVRTQLHLATSSDMNVSIVAPQGCGREKIARSVFYNRPPLQGRLLPLSCDLLDTELLETSLASFQSSRAEFFTGVDVPDTLLFLDIDRLSHECQLLLDRLIRQGAWDYRVLTTSAQELEEIDFLPLVSGTFTTLTIRVPPLADRSDDVPLLAQHFLERLNRDGEQHGGFSRTALEHLQAYNWPGDLEQLAQVVQEACESAHGTRVEVADLPKRIHWYMEDLIQPQENEPIQLDEFLRSIEQRLVNRALELANGNKAQAARLLGITRTRVIRRVAEGGSENPE